LLQIILLNKRKSRVLHQKQNPNVVYAPLKSQNKLLLPPEAKKVPSFSWYFSNFCTPLQPVLQH